MFAEHCAQRGVHTITVSTSLTETPTAAGTTICAGNTASLSATGCATGQTYRWYAENTQTTVLANTASYNPSPTASTSYFVACVLGGSCTGPLRQVDVTVHPTGTPTVVVAPTQARLCPATPVILTASGCSAGVVWTYNIAGGAGGSFNTPTNTTTLNYASLPFSTAWADGASATFKAKCNNDCQPVTSAEVSIQKLADCNATPLSCDFYIKAADATGQETTRLTRTTTGGSTYNPLNLSVVALDGTNPTGLTYSWTGPSPLTPSGGTTYSAAHVGEYKVNITATGQTGTCELYISLSSTPCSTLTAPACDCTPDITDPSKINCTPAPVATLSSTTEYLTALAPGDQFTANDFVITVTSVSGGAAGFSGEGYVTPKLLGSSSIGVTVEFSNIKLNPCYQLIQGSVKTKYDPSWSNVVDVDAVIEDLKGLVNELSDLLSIYTGTQQEKDKINQLLSKIENQAKNSADLPDDNKTQFEVLWPKVLTEWDKAQQCGGTPTGRIGANQRIATTATSGDPSACIKPFNDTYQQATNFLNPSFNAPCITFPPTINNDDKEGQKKIQSGNTESNFPIDCYQSYYYFDGPTPLMTQWVHQTGINTSPPTWNKGWYIKEEYIKRIKPVIEALGIISGDVRILSTNADQAFRNAIALLDQFSAQRTNKLHADFFKNIAPEYGTICQELYLRRGGSGATQPVYIEFDIAALGEGVLRTIISSGLQKIANATSATTVAFLSKIGNASTKKAYIAWQVNKASKTQLAEINTQGYLTGIRWATQPTRREQIVTSLSEVPNVSPANTTRIGNITFRNAGNEIIATEASTLLSQQLPSRAVNVAPGFTVATMKGNGAPLILSPNDRNAIFRVVISTENNRYADLCEQAVEDALKALHPDYEKITSIYNTSGNGIDILLAKFRSNNGVRELEELIAVEVKSRRIGDPNDITTGFFQTQTNRITLGTGYTGRQMDRVWFDGVIGAMETSGLNAEAGLIREAIIKGILHKYLAGVDKSGTSYILKLN